MSMSKKEKIRKHLQKDSEKAYSVLNARYALRILGRLNGPLDLAYSLSFFVCKDEEESEEPMPSDF